MKNHFLILAYHPPISIEEYKKFLTENNKRFSEEKIGSKNCIRFYISLIYENGSAHFTTSLIFYENDHITAQHLNYEDSNTYAPAYWLVEMALSTRSWVINSRESIVEGEPELDQIELERINKQFKMIASEGNHIIIIPNNKL